MSETKRNMIFISLVNWNSWQDTISCINSIEKLEINRFKVFIRILDNASPNNSFEELRTALPNYDVIKLENNDGYAAGHLENLKYAQSIGADFFWILNSDIKISSHTLQAFIDAYQKNGDQIYGSVTLDKNQSINFAGSPVYNNNKLNYNKWKGKPYQELIEKHHDVQQVQSVEGSSIFIPLTIIQRHGFMKTDFFMYGEETDFCLRLNKVGVKSYVVSKSIIFHENSGSMKGCEAFEAIPAYYRRRNFLRLSIEHLKMKNLDALRYKSSITNTLKSVIKGKFSKKKNTSYYYALANLHAWMGKRGKVIKPEKLYEQCLSSQL